MTGKSARKCKEKVRRGGWADRRMDLVESVHRAKVSSVKRK